MNLAQSVTEEVTNLPSGSNESKSYDVNSPSGTTGDQPGTCRAEIESGPAASGTSGADSLKLSGTDIDEDEQSESASALVSAERKPRLRIAPSAPNGNVGLPYVSVDAAGQAVTPARRAPVINGEIRIGRMYEKRGRFERLKNAGLSDLLQSDQLEDTVIEADGTTEFSVVDLDTHDWTQKPTAQYLDVIAADIFPEPDAWWITHGLGLKLVYVGPYHQSRALAAAFSAPSSFTVELLQHTRHPRSASTSDRHRGASCGPVHFTGANSNAEFEFRGVGRLTPEARQAALDDLGLEEGGRYDHDRCPIDPDTASDAKDCVHVLERGVFCHRCAAKGIHFRETTKAGYYPFTPAGSVDSTCLDQMAKHRVHWTHARIELEFRYPKFGPNVLRRAYERAISEWVPGDQLREMVFEPNLDFVRGDGLWLDSTRLEVTQLDNDAIEGMAYAHEMEERDGQEIVRLDTVRRATLKHRTPKGYSPIRPVRGISFRLEDPTIPILAPPKQKHKVELLASPLPLDEAFDQLEKAFPKVDRRYLQAVLAAVICADAKLGQPPMLTCRGPSGSGKEQHIRVAASFMGEVVQKLTLSDSDEAFKRQLGFTLAAGHRFLMFDEFGKTPGLAKKIKSILEISTWIQWRPLYENRLVSTPMHAALFFPCVTFPDFLCSSEEFVRRTQDVQLYRKLPDWRESSGGDAAQWRDRSPQNALIANSILTHTWRLCREVDYRFCSVAESLELGTLADSEPAMDPELLRQLYRHARGELASRVMFENNNTFSKGWIKMNDPALKAVVSAFVPLDEDNDIKKARVSAQNNLHAQAWNDILGIESPPILIQVKIHGSEWGYRFISGMRVMKGREQINEQLPPIPGDVKVDRDVATDRIEVNVELSLEEAMMQGGLK